jgi:histone acetyltransferase 1
MDVSSSISFEVRSLILIVSLAELYKAIYQYVLSRPGVAELTVEDPAEAFEDLRDRNDLKMLLSNERFIQEGFGEVAVSHGGGKVAKKTGRAKARSQGKLGPPADRAWVEKWRVELKIAGVSVPESRK